MGLRIHKDSNNQPYIQWQQHREGMPNATKRAWIQTREGEQDWAGTGRYLNVVRCGPNGNPAGNPTDFPIYNDLPDTQLLTTFVTVMNAITGCAEAS